MPINPNIAMSYRGVELPQQNALADYAAIQQIQGGRQAQELNALKMQEAQAALTERNALRQLNPAAADYENQLFKVSPQLGIQYRKETATTAAQKAAQAKSDFDLKAAQRKFGDDLKRGLSANPSDANIIAFGEDAVLQGLYTPDQVKATVSQLLALPAPDRVRILSQAGATAGELRPVAVGSSLMTSQGQLLATAPRQPQLLTPEEEAQKARIASAGRAPVQPRAPAITTVEDPNNPGKFLQVDANQYKGGGANAPGVIGGARPSALSEKTATQKVQTGKDINQAIFELKSVVKPGGLIDQSTGSGAGRLYDIGAGFVGQAPEGAVAAGQLAPIADLVLKMVPRFEGPQSDKDTMSYKAAAGQLADSSLPTKIRKAAANEIIRLMEARKAQFGSADMAAPAGTGVDTSNPLLK